MDEKPTQPEGAADADPGAEDAAQTSRPRRRLFRKRKRDEPDDVGPAAEAAVDSDADGDSEQPSAEEQEAEPAPAPGTRQGKPPSRGSIKRDRQRLDGERQDTIPPTLPELERCRPVLEDLPGWPEDIREVRQWQDLPAATQTYLQRIEELAGVPIQLVSVGPDREETILLHNPFA